MSDKTGFGPPNTLFYVKIKSWQKFWAKLANFGDFFISSGHTAHLPTFDNFIYLFSRTRSNSFCLRFLNLAAIGPNVGLDKDVPIPGLDLVKKINKFS